MELGSSFKTNLFYSNQFLKVTNVHQIHVVLTVVAVVLTVNHSASVYQNSKAIHLNAPVHYLKIHVVHHRAGQIVSGKKWSFLRDQDSNHKRILKLNKKKTLFEQLNVPYWVMVSLSVHVFTVSLNLQTQYEAVLSPKIHANQILAVLVLYAIHREVQSAHVRNHSLVIHSGHVHLLL